MNGWTVANIVASSKKFTARKICDDWRESAQCIPGTPNSRLAPNSPVWQREYGDRYIRDQIPLNQVIEYIHLNPIKSKPD
jgi:hypothetical protein